MTERPSVVQRMDEELEELNGRIDRLTAFVLKNTTFATLPDVEQELMNKQLDHMRFYRDALAARHALIERRLGL